MCILSKKISNYKIIRIIKGLGERRPSHSTTVRKRGSFGGTQCTLSVSRKRLTFTTGVKSTNGQPNNQLPRLAKFRDLHRAP